MRRVARTLAACMVGIVACDSATEPDPCAEVARVGEVELFIGSTTGLLEDGEIVLVGDTLPLFAEASEVLDVSIPFSGALCEVDYGPPIQTAIEWSSSDDRVATVSATGRVIGRAPGDATITARAPTLAVSASHEIEVRAGVD